MGQNATVACSSGNDSWHCNSCNRFPGIINLKKFAYENLGFKIIKTNFTAAGFTTERVVKAKKVENAALENTNNKVKKRFIFPQS